MIWPPQDTGVFEPPACARCHQDLECSVAEGQATLCGTQEFADQSSPVRVYRKFEWAGSMLRCCLGTDKYTYTGSCELNALTCEPTNSLEILYESGPGGEEPPCDCGEGFTDSDVTVVDCPSGISVPNQSTNPADSVTTVTKTTYEQVGLETCAPSECALFGTTTATLSVEDTEADAITRFRANEDWSSFLPFNKAQCTAYYEERTIGTSFDYREVKWRVVRNGLLPATSYDVSVDIMRRVYGSMGAFSLYATLVETVVTDANGNLFVEAYVPNDAGFESYAKGPITIAETP
jgi:hypothetical protein